MKAITTYSKVSAITVALLIFLATLGVSSVYSADTVVLRSDQLIWEPGEDFGITMSNGLAHPVAQLKFIWKQAPFHQLIFLLLLP